MNNVRHISQLHSTRLLIVGPTWVGDMIMAQSLFKTLKQQDPGLTLDVLAPSWSKPLLERMPEVNDVITMPLEHGQLRLRTRYRLGRRLRDHDYDQAIVLPNSLKSALVPFWARIPQRTGFRGELRWGLLNDMRTLDASRLPMMVQRFVALGLDHDTSLPPPVPPVTLEVKAADVTAALSRLSLERPTSPILGLCPGAEYGPAKRWPAEYFAKIARHQQEAGWTVWIFGSKKDAAIGRQIASRIESDCVDLTGRTNLAEAVDLMSLTSLVVTNDSGLMHVAAALDRTLIAIYGSSDPGFTPPLSQKAQILSLALPCSPCFERRCPLAHLKCLRDLSPAQVLSVIDQETV